MFEELSKSILFLMPQEFYLSKSCWNSIYLKKCRNSGKSCSNIFLKEADRNISSFNNLSINH